ncbi:MAG TPA: hypothetical protein VFK36_00120 [Gemmatimonadales bacterium]|nr:hypothetical protein [Gemmatimonadales bacterium]
MTHDLRRISALFGVALLASCSTSTENSTFEPDITKMVITVSTTCASTSPGTDYVATEASNGFGGATANVSTGLFCVRGSFFKPSGAIESSLPAQDFELGVSTSSTIQVLSTPLAFEPNGSNPLEGILSGLEDGQEVTFYFSLYHKSQGHPDFGPYALKIHYSAPAPPGGGGGGGDL